MFSSVPWRREVTLFEAVATIVGTVIGAGVLGVPYAMNMVGFVPGVLILAALTYVAATLHLMLGEVTLRTKGEHQWVGYYSLYFGPWAKYAMTALFLLALYGSILAYIIGVGNVLAALFGGDFLWYSLGFAVVSSYFIYAGLTLVKRSEFVLIIALLSIVLGIFYLGRDVFRVPDLGAYSWRQWVVPYGVFLFALSGSSAIPEVRRELLRNEGLMKKGIIWGTLIPAFVYLIFTFFTLGVNGGNVTEIATVGLGNVLGTKMVILGNTFAFFAMGTSMLTIGLAVRDMFRFDYRFSRSAAWAATMVPPLVLFFISNTGFVRVLNIVGGVIGGLISIFSIFLFWRARKKGNRTPEYSLGKKWAVGTLLVLMYTVGMWYSLVGS